MTTTNTTTLFDLNQSASGAAITALGKDALQVDKIKLDAFDMAGFDDADYAQFSAYFHQAVQNFTNLRQTLSPATKATQAATQAAAPSGAATAAAAANAKTAPANANKTAAAAAVSVLAALLLLICNAHAGLYSIGSGGWNIPSNTQSNLPVLVPIGTFTLNPQYLTISEGGVSNGGPATLYGRLTFDGTNFYQIPQTFALTNQSSSTAINWNVTNQTFTVYGQLTVTNGTPGVISNLSAIGQN